MAGQPILPRRDLSRFLKDPRDIKQFEKLFSIANEVSSDTDTQGIKSIAVGAEAMANLANDRIDELQHNMEVMLWLTVE